MLDDKKFLEHTELFEKYILTNMEKSIENLNRYLFSNNDTPKIYITLLDKDSDKYSYFLFPIVEHEDDNVYVNKEYNKLIEIENTEYMGYYLLGEEKFRFIFTLQKDERFNEVIDKLYNSFLVSNVTFNSIDKRYTNRMYKIKIKSMIDDIENITDAKIVYNLDDSYLFNVNVYWNVNYEKLISKKNLTFMSDISYMYTLEKTKENFYLIDSTSDVVEDVINYDTHVEIYSSLPNIYLFNVFCIYPFDKRFISNYVDNVFENIKIRSLDSIKNIFSSKYGIKVSNPLYSSEDLSHLLVPNYDDKVIKFKTSYIYFKLEKFSSYEDVFHVVNFLNLNLESYEVRVYE